MTESGWKVSYHLVYPLLTFPDTSRLKIVALQIANLPHLCFSDSKGGRHCFVDTAVFSKNQLIRLPLNWKLSDRTCTPLRMPGAQSLVMFQQASITCLNANAWRVPNDKNLATLAPIQKEQCKPIFPAQRPCLTRCKLSPAEAQSDVPARILTLLKANDYPEGRLQSRDQFGSCYLWHAVSSDTPRPCNVAQIWRPDKPIHISNGAIMSIDSWGAVFVKCLHP